MLSNCSLYTSDESLNSIQLASLDGEMPADTNNGTLLSVHCMTINLKEQ
jgi:hypothetical protein